MEKLHGNHISHISRDVHAHHPLDFSSVHSFTRATTHANKNISFENNTIRAI